MRFLGLLLQICYRCRRHFLMGVRVDILGVSVSLLGAFIALSQHARGWGVLLLTVSIASLFALIYAQRKGYVIFQPASGARPSPPLPEYESDLELPARASGLFAIRDQVRYLAHHPAILTTPASREHVLMAQLAPSRFLLLAKSPSGDWGWWYQFIPAAAINVVTVGSVTHGWHRQPALKISYQVSVRQDEEETAETVLSFESEELRLLAWANLTAEIRARPTTG